MNWNPITRPYCRDCPHYQATGMYVYQLERDPAERRCRHLARCKRVADRVLQEAQISMFNGEGGK